MKKALMIVLLGFLGFIPAGLISSAGAPQIAWVASYDNPDHGGDTAIAMCLDDNGNVYITGYSIRAGLNYDYVTLKYNRSGILQWASMYDGPAHGRDFTYGIAVDAAGDVYVTGSSEGIGTAKDYATIKYDGATGAQLWVDRIARSDGEMNLDDIATAIAVDPWGNIIVTGYVFHPFPASGQDSCTVKYDPDGNRIWLKEYDLRLDQPFSSDAPVAMTVDGNGDIYIVETRMAFNADLGVFKLDSDGNFLWGSAYDAGYYENARALAIDEDAVYITGRALSPGPGYDTDWLTVAFRKTDGGQIWCDRYEGDSASNSYDTPQAIVADGQGNVFVTGSGVYSDTGHDYTTIKYRYDPVAQAVARAWVARYSNPENSPYGDAAQAIALDTAGNVYINGESTGYAAVKYDPLGHEEWVIRYEGSGVNGSAICVDPSGNVFMTGTRPEAGGSNNIVTLCLAQNQPPVAEAGPDLTAVVCASVSFDGAGSFDPDGSIANFHWDFGDGTSIDGAPAGHVFRSAGVYTVTLIVTDDFGATASDTATVTVKSFSDALQILIDLVYSYQLPQGLENSLIAKLKNAQKSLTAANADHRRDAMNHVQAFVHEVNAQRGKGLTDAQADQLLYWAMRLLAGLGNEGC